MRTLLKSNLLSLLAIFIFFISANAQTKKLKRPSSRVGVSSIDQFVRESFDLYDKVYMYDGYAKAGTPLSDEDIDVLEQALDDVTGLSDSAPDILSDIEGIGVLKQSKATLQINRAKKALKYSIKTSKELLLNKHNEETEEEAPTTSEQGNDTSNSPNNTSSEDNVDDNVPSQTKTLEVYSKFDYVPGDKQLFFDDFSNDFIGDFPAKWNTNGTGEIVTLGDSQQKWLELKSGYNIVYIPDVPVLPEEYTIEFDTKVIGIDRQTSSNAGLEILLSDDPKFNSGDNHVRAWIPYGQYGAFDIRMRNYINRGGGDINSALKADIRKAVLESPHFSIAVNKQRLRLWVNEKKYVDIPRIMPNEKRVTTLKFNLNHFKDGKERLFITNVKVAEGGVDLRRKLISDGKVSTNGILFDSGSNNLKAESMGIIRQISQVLQQESGMSLKIVGHTDADGADDTNMKLSKDRAEAVKNALVNIYDVDSNRLSTEGKGESEPVADNNSANGKAQNRRVEFIKQ
ncbi:OmpA family protein [Croceitalea rosinachiae]|uniref:OmpA family protein n=1 Tax=Croceitalea rosinachiae TaxID=3075596 RepID=A0ABU3A9N9_9FLAO|nr:OmpA family protein [Croceitalea sp. F388]MDT0606891.1 OmpA family protein [Croceitalea sp. F388]